MERYIDLHTHSNNSDGSMTAAELVEHAKNSGLAAVALTDHDTIGGLAEAEETAVRAGIEFVRGIELSAKSETETHILGYFIDPKEQGLLKALDEVKKARQERTLETSDILKKLGMDVPMEEVMAIAPSGIIGRAHFARVMMEKGYVASVKEAFDKYLANGKPAYCERQHLTDEQAVEIIKNAGGKAFLAHVHLTRKDGGELINFLKRLKTAGLDGLEGYYSEYTPEMQEKYQKLARDMDLKICGGTDFHADMKPHISIGKGLGNLRIPYSVLEELRIES
ncbi:MAG: PHP domain-containing protein [Oscillospiraceae bacterium]|nr:PHP domain-containing protein [Oscillospiraceae bacterium]